MSAPSDRGSDPQASTPAARPGLVLNRFAAAAAERRAALTAVANANAGANATGKLPQRVRFSVLGGAQQSLNFYGPSEVEVSGTAGR